MFWAPFRMGARDVCWWVPWRGRRASAALTPQMLRCLLLQCFRLEMPGTRTPTGVSRPEVQRPVRERGIEEKESFSARGRSIQKFAGVKRAQAVMCRAEKMELHCSKRQIKLPGTQWTQQPRYLPTFLSQPNFQP